MADWNSGFSATDSCASSVQDASWSSCKHETGLSITAMSRGMSSAVNVFSRFAAAMENDRPASKATIAAAVAEKEGTDGGFCRASLTNFTRNMLDSFSRMDADT